VAAPSQQITDQPLENVSSRRKVPSLVRTRVSYDACTDIADRRATRKSAISLTFRLRRRRRPEGPRALFFIKSHLTHGSEQPTPSAARERLKECHYLTTDGSLRAHNQLPNSWLANASQRCQHTRNITESVTPDKVGESAFRAPSHSRNKAGFFI